MIYSECILIRQYLSKRLTIAIKHREQSLATLQFSRSHHFPFSSHTSQLPIPVPRHSAADRLNVVNGHHSSSPLSQGWQPSTPSLPIGPPASIAEAKPPGSNETSTSPPVRYKYQ
jgi:hypothetical protein